MARLPRLVLAGQPHLLIQRALDGQPIFTDTTELARLTEVLRMGLADERVRLHAYALRPQEILLVATPPDAGALSRLMQTLGRRYVVAYNRQHERSGTLWNGRFSAAAVETGEPLLQAMAWVEQTGEQAGGQLEATSAAHHLGERTDPMVCDPPSWWSLGNTPFARQAAWQQRLARGFSDQEAAALRRAARGGWALGSAGFVRAAAAPGRPAAPRAPGRPRARPH